MELLKKYFKIQKEIYDYFGYKEDWCVIPLEDSTQYYWFLKEDLDFVRYANSIKDLRNKELGEYYEASIYRQRFLPKWVYRSKDYTMVSVDTHIDGNKFLMVFDNKKEVKIERVKCQK